MTCAGSALASSSDLMRCQETVTPKMRALMTAALKLAPRSGPARRAAPAVRAYAAQAGQTVDDFLQSQPPR
jgi:hypothetical protein